MAGSFASRRSSLANSSMGGSARSFNVTVAPAAARSDSGTPVALVQVADAATGALYAQQVVSEEAEGLQINVTLTIRSPAHSTGGASAGGSATATPGSSATHVVAGAARLAAASSATIVASYERCALTFGMGQCAITK